MNRERKMQPVIRKVSFTEVEEIDVAYYASINWKESVAIVEDMRMGIWQDAYEKHNEVEKIIRKRALKEEDDEFE